MVWDANLTGLPPYNQGFQLLHFRVRPIFESLSFFIVSREDSICMSDVVNSLSSLFVSDIWMKSCIEAWTELLKLILWGGNWWICYFITRTIKPHLNEYIEIVTANSPSLLHSITSSLRVWISFIVSCLNHNYALWLLMFNFSVYHWSNT